MKIAGIGSACLDRIHQLEAWPEEDGSTHILSTITQGGGAAATAIVTARRLGLEAAMIAAVGTDEAGTEIRQGLEQEGVDTSCLQVYKGTSPHSEIMVSPDGSRTKFVQNNTLPPVVWNEACRNMIRTSDAIHLDGTRYDNAVAAAEIAEEAGVLISLDGCHMQEDHQKDIRLACMADVLIMNARYPMMTTGLAMEQALLFYAEHCKVVITTRGADGCYAVMDGKVVHFPAYQVHAVDTTGCGDVFHGAFLTAYLEHQPMKACIAFAEAAAALKSLQPGGRTGIPDRSTVAEFMKDHPDPWILQKND
ncbi:MAG: carbohydrate kinase family protein [Bulleidia sp.]